MADLFEFGAFRLDAAEHRLLRDGLPVPLTPKAFDLLVHLIRHAGRLREKKQLMEALWPDSFVEEVNLAYTVSAVRRALGDDRSRPQFIETVATKGYRFVAAVTVLDEPDVPEGRAVVRERPVLDEDTHEPYPGLRSFTEQDAAVFFGREEEVASLWTRIRAHRLLAVIGPSGAGKTSFVRAGVIPQTPGGWTAVVCTPGTAPLRALGQALASELANDVEAVRQLVSFEDPEVAFAVVCRWRQAHGQALIVIDQFEELFTNTPPEVQIRVADFVGRLADEADVHVVLSMRDDFFMRCHEHDALAGVFADVTPLGALPLASLRRALVEPARRLGYRFEDEALVDDMIDSLKGARAALPMLAFAVARLWELGDREHKLLTRAAYERIGGVAGALAQHADATLDRIGAALQDLVRDVFRNLVTAQGTRAVIHREELLSAFPDRPEAEGVLRALVDARLLTAYEVKNDAGEQSRHRLEIVHESLLTAWPRLVRWQAQDEEGAVLRDQLKQAAHLWEEKGRPPDLLWTGTAYEEFKLWRQRYPGSLTTLEADFAHSATERVRRRTRLTRLAAGIAFLAITGVAIAIGISRQQATHARDRANVAALHAEASALLTLAELRLAEDPTEALAYAIASLEQADTLEARVFAMKVLWESPPAFELEAGSHSVHAPAFSPDGRWLATAGFSTDALAWSNDGRGPLVLPGHVTSPRGGNEAHWASNDLLVTGQVAGNGSRVQVWSLPEGRRLRTIDFGRPGSWQVGRDKLYAQILEDGSSEAPRDGSLRSWSLPGGEPATLGKANWATLETTVGGFAPDGRNWLYVKGRNVYLRPLPAGKGSDRLFGRLGADFLDLKVLTDPDRLMVAEKSGDTHVWSLPRDGLPRETIIPHPDTAPSGVFPDPSGRWLSADPNVDAQVRLWDVTSWRAARPLTLRRRTSWYLASVTFEPKGPWAVASTASSTNLTFWPLGRLYPVVVDGYKGLTRPLAFSPDSKWLVTDWGDERLRLWSLPGRGVADTRRLDRPQTADVKCIKFDVRGQNVVAVGNGGHAWVVPVDGSTPRGLQGFSEDSLLAAAAISPSGRLLAAAPSFGQGAKTLRVWDLETGEGRQFALPGGPQSAQEGPGSATGTEQGIRGMAFAGESVLYTAGDGGLRRWNLVTGSNELVAAASPGYSMTAAFSADGHVALTVESRPPRDEPCARAVLYDLPSGTSRELKQFGGCGTVRATGIALDPSGTVAATTGFDAIVRVGRVSSGEPALLVGHTGTVDRIAISSDLRWVATSGTDNTLRLWPMPDLSKPPLHTLPLDQLLAKLRSLSNLRAVRDPGSATGWKIEVAPFPGWRNVPTW